MRRFFKYVSIIGIIALALLYVKNVFIIENLNLSKRRKPSIDLNQVITRYKEGISTTKPHFSSLIKDSDLLVSQIKERCRSENMSADWSMDLNPLPKPRMLLFRAEQGMLYASNPKTGCTSFRVFMYLLDKVPRRQIKDLRLFEKFQKHYQVKTDLQTESWK